jgi:hypothetical protein
MGTQAAAANLLPKKFIAVGFSQRNNAVKIGGFSPKSRGEV